MRLELYQRKDDRIWCIITPEFSKMTVRDGCY